MTNTATYEQIKELPHLKIEKEDLNDRFIPFFALYDTQWKQYFHTGTSWINLQIVDIEDGLYFSKSPLINNDLLLLFFNIMYKKANFKEKSKFIYAILDDIQNLSASIQKIDFFYKMKENLNTTLSSRYVSTELEYIFKVTRSIFDLLQELINVVWERFEFLDTEKEKKSFSKNCKTSFNSVIEYNNKLSSVEELIERHTIPKELAEFYYANGEFFTWIRSYRDKITHSGATFEIFVGEEGFSLSIKDNHFSYLPFWSEKNTLQNNLGSVKSLVAYVVLNTINALEMYAETINKIVRLPTDMVPEYNLYLRSRFNGTLIDLQTYFDENAWNKKDDQ